MAQPKYIAHKKKHTLHVVGGCGFAEGYSNEKYDEYFTIGEAKACHGKKLHPCRYCSIDHNLHL